MIAVTGFNGLLLEIILHLLEEFPHRLNIMVQDNNGKFFAPKTIDVSLVRKGLMESNAQVIRKRTQNIVAIQMAVGVVDMLEMVDIQGTN